jgi:hypothetical protein
LEYGWECGLDLFVRSGADHRSRPDIPGAQVNSVCPALGQLDKFRYKDSPATLALKRTPTIATVKPTDLFAATGLLHADTLAQGVERELLAIIDEAAA